VEQNTPNAMTGQYNCRNIGLRKCLTK